MKTRKKPHSARLPLAITLIAASFVSAIFISTIANKGQNYWVINAPIIPGHTISTSDVVLRHLNLKASSDLYLGQANQPIGMIATRTMRIGEVISKRDLSSAVGAQSTSAVPLSIRSVDISQGLVAGESVDIYWVQDARNGEIPVDPILILGGVTLLSIENTGNSFSGEVGLSIAVEQTQVLRILSATTVGRLVVIGSNV